MLEQQFLLSVSHDLRTPLTSIRGYAEAITDGAAEPAAAAGVIQSESRRLERLVADLLDLAKLQSRSFSLHPAPLDLRARRRPRPCPASCPTRPSATCSCRCNDRSTRCGVAPIPTGSRRWPPTSSRTRWRYARFEVDRRRRCRRPTVTVDDDGPGIDAGDLPHVFERLYASRSQPQRRESSSGLGLAIVRELVDAMGGEVGAGVAPSGGARLWFRLPPGWTDSAGTVPRRELDTFPRQYARTQRLTLGEPRNVVVSPDGQRVVFARSRGGDDPVNCLWVLDVASGEERLVADPLALLGVVDDEELPPEERARRERIARGRRRRHRVRHRRGRAPSPRSRSPGGCSSPG